MPCRTRLPQNLRPFSRPHSGRPYPWGIPSHGKGARPATLRRRAVIERDIAAGRITRRVQGCRALPAPARSGPEHRLAPKTRAHRGLWQNDRAGRQPSSKRYLSIHTPGDGPAPRSLPITPHRRALQPARPSGSDEAQMAARTRAAPPRGERRRHKGLIPARNSPRSPAHRPASGRGSPAPAHARRSGGWSGPPAPAPAPGPCG